MKRIYHIAILLFGALGFSGCPDEGPVDPCSGITTQFKADFSIYEQIRDNTYPTDTVLSWNTTLFIASTNCDSVTWIVGNDTRRWYTDTLRLRFPKSIGEVIPVTLIAKKTRICVAGDDGIDTVRKFLKVVDGTESRMIGAFKGYHNSDITDTQTVSIVYQKWAGGHPDPAYSFMNFQRCDEPGALVGQPNFAYFVGYRSLYFNGSGAETSGVCGSATGYAVLESNHNTLSINYSTLDSTSKVNGVWKEFWRTRSFQGVRQ